MANRSITSSQPVTGGHHLERTLRMHGPWVLQVGLAALFAFAGAGKLTASSEFLRSQFGLSPAFMRFIGVCEVLGAIGLVAPGVFRIWRSLTPVAAGGLVLIMAGATIVTEVNDSILMAVGPAAVGAVAALVVRSRAAWLSEAGLARTEHAALAWRPDEA